MKDRLRFNYILDAEHNVLPVEIWNGRKFHMENMAFWGGWFESYANRKVADNRIGPFRVSTVFLGIDHRFDGKGAPIVFETMVFDHNNPQVLNLLGRARVYMPEVYNLTNRYCTWDEAVEGHRKTVGKLRRLFRGFTKRERAEAKAMAKHEKKP